MPVECHETRGDDCSSSVPGVAGRNVASGALQRSEAELCHCIGTSYAADKLVARQEEEGGR